METFLIVYAIFYLLIQIEYIMNYREEKALREDIAAHLEGDIVFNKEKVEKYLGFYVFSGLANLFWILSGFFRSDQYFLYVAIFVLLFLDKKHKFFLFLNILVTIFLILNYKLGIL